MNTANAIPVTYDKYGRMQYHPDYHAKHGTPWTTGDEKYLIENYYALGPEQVSFALERTVHTVMTRAFRLRDAGQMSMPLVRTCAKRSRKL